MRHSPWSARNAPRLTRRAATSPMASRACCCVRAHRCHASAMPVPCQCHACAMLVPGTTEPTGQQCVRAYSLICTISAHMASTCTDTLHVHAHVHVHVCLHACMHVHVHVRRSAPRRTRRLSRTSPSTASSTLTTCGSTWPRSRHAAPRHTLRPCAVRAYDPTLPDPTTLRCQTLQPYVVRPYNPTLPEPATLCCQGVRPYVARACGPTLLLLLSGGLREV